MNVADRWYRNIVEAAPDGVVVVDQQGTILLANRQAEHMFGYQRDELIGQRIELLVPERFRPSHPRHRGDYVATPRVRPMGSGLELSGRRKDGSELPIEISLSPIDTEEGVIIASSIRDVSERRAAQAALRRLAAIVDSSNDAIISRTLDGTITSWNRGAEQIYGFTAAEMIGQTIAPLIPPGREDEESRLLQRIARGERVEHFETVRRTKDGREIDMSITLSPVLDPAGAVIGASKVGRDITDRKRVEAEARRATHYLVSAVDSIQDAFLLFDPADRLVLVNSASRNLLAHVIAGPIVGRSLDELIRACVAAGWCARPGEADADAVARLLAYHRTPVGAFDLRTPDGHSLRATARRTPEGGTLSVVADITDDVLRAEELQRARAQAEAASAAKSEFLASMSHELRTPLNAVLGFAQLLQRDRKEPLSARQLERLSHVLRGGEHLLRLIDDVLDLARIEAGRVTISTEPVGVRELVEEVVATLEPMAHRAGINLAIAPLPPALPPVVADRTRLAQILMNYGSNAIKYGRAGGHAIFRVHHQGAAVRLAVEDDGLGIPDDKRHTIFEPFQRAGQETGSIEGTGIGLAISKRLAEMMRGAVGFASAQGEGSQFWVEVPAHADARPTARAGNGTGASASPLSNGHRQHRVVYVEDNPSNIAFMREVVEDLGAVELVTAPTAEIGLELIRAQPPDVVILDINLPGMSGYDALRALRATPETSAIPVIALSAAARTEDTSRAQDAGFFRYLTKPVKIDELTTTLEELLID